MAYEVVLQVTQPYHGRDGEVLYEPGQQFPQDADLPLDLRVTPVITGTAGKPQAKPAPKPGKAGA